MSDPARPRYEFKYVVPLEAGQAFLTGLGDAMCPDRHGAEGAYRVTSRYYDSSALRAYYEKLDGVDPRYKVRLRTYGPARREEAGEDAGAARVFVEVKHRRGQRIHKDRVALAAEALAPHLERQVLALPLRDLCAAAERETGAVIEGILQREPLRPACVVSYARRAYLGRVDRGLRVTLDTDLRALGPMADPARALEDGELFLPRGLGVLELKFHWSMPLWLLDMTQALGLQLRRYSKYAAALERVLPQVAMRELRLSEPGR